MEDRLRLLALRDGGQFAYDEYGDPKGPPVFFCHGWPSSRTMAEFTDAAARDLGVRIISPDRPGIRGSTFQAQRKLTDWPPLLQQLAHHLGIDRFRILAISGGAPYGYVTAWAMPERVRAMAIVSGAPPILEVSDQSDLWAFYRWMLHCYCNYPRFSRLGFRFARPFLSLRPPRRMHPWLLKLLPPADAAALRDSRAFDICFESQREAWRVSAMGVLADAEIYAKPWGFALEDVTVPIRLWHGKEDRAFAFRLAEEVARRLPNCTARYVDKTGHFSLPIRHMHEILADLISV